VPIAAFVARRKVLLFGLALLLVAGVAGRLVVLDRGRPGPAPEAAGPPAGKSAAPRLLGAPAASATIQLPRGVTDLLAADGSVWAASSEGVQRIDPTTNSVVARIHLPDVGDRGHLAWADGSMWATQESGVLTRIDPLTNRAIANIPLGGPPMDVVAGDGLWVSVFDLSNSGVRVLTIDPTSNSISSSWQLAPAMGRLSFVDGRLWVGSTNGSPRVASIDPADGRMSAVREHELPETSADGALWATANDVARIDPRSGSILATVDAGDVDQVAAGLGAVWILTRTGSRSNSIYRPDPKKPATVVAIDPSTNRIVGVPVPVGISPAHMTVGSGAVWVAQYDSGLVTRVELG
jgi:DNA-binding beta-propeller fold protein YncE